MGKNFSGNSNKLRPKSDFYQTPYTMTRQLLERENFDGNILEPSCGQGAIVKELINFGYPVDYKDDSFLECKTEYDNIVTNPPFSLAQEFILHAKKIAQKKIAFLLPLSYLHGKKRHDTIWMDRTFPLKKVYVFTRYPMLSENIREDGKYKTGMMVYAWYIWDRKYSGQPMIEWIDNNEFVINKKSHS